MMEGLTVKLPTSFVGSILIYILFHLEFGKSHITKLATGLAVKDERLVYLISVKYTVMYTLYTSYAREVIVLKPIL